MTKRTAPEMVAHRYGLKVEDAKAWFADARWIQGCANTMVRRMGVVRLVLLQLEWALERAAEECGLAASRIARKRLNEGFSPTRSSVPSHFRHHGACSHAPMTECSMVHTGTSWSAPV